MSEEPVRHRRRGDQLEADIRDAVFAELAEAGYRGLSMQGVARLCRGLQLGGLAIACGWARRGLRRLRVPPAPQRRRLPGGML